MTLGKGGKCNSHSLQFTFKQPKIFTVYKNCFSGFQILFQQQLFFFYSNTDRFFLPPKSMFHLSVSFILYVSHLLFVPTTQNWWCEDAYVVTQSKNKMYTVHLLSKKKPFFWFNGGSHTTFNLLACHMDEPYLKKCHLSIYLLTCSYLLF